MAPEKTDPESGDDTPNSSTISLDTSSTVGETEREPYFEPVVCLPEVPVKTNEEEEIELLRLRCKLFRYYNQESPSEWKERGVGDVKILHNIEKATIRLLMRQDKTLKVRANHYITPFMELQPNCSSDRAWVWSAISDFADEEPKHETFAIRFANVDHAKLFKEKFDEARGIITVALMRGRELLEEARKKDLTENPEDENGLSTGTNKDVGVTEEIAKEFEQKLTVKEDVQENKTN